MSRRGRLCPSLALTTLALWCAAAAAETRSFVVSDEQLARLGVTLREPERVARVEIASAPARIVVPPGQQALVSAPVGGVVARLLVAEGDTVERGQVLAELQSADYLDAQREYLDAAANAELAAAQAERDRGLFEEGIIAQRRRDESAAAARAARALLDQTRTQLTLAGLDEADLARLRGGRELATRLVLRASLPGVVAAVHAQVGARLDALDAVLSVADLSTLWLELRLRQESAAHVQPGMTAVAAVGAGTVRGTITTVGRVVDPATQTVLVRAALEDPDVALRAGQFVTARVQADAPGGSAYALPAAALTREGGEDVLFVRRGGNFDARAVTVLAQDGATAYVGETIEAPVAVEGISALKALWLSEAEGS
jgi:cobalt-zinc-cadmium efflux system membrane fusion protein